MATLRRLLMNGTLGPIHVGLTPSEVMNIVGEPEESSRKKNPLILRYGSLELTFVKVRDHQRLELRRFVLGFHGRDWSLPQSIKLSDWKPTEPPSPTSFDRMARELGCKPEEAALTAGSGYLLFPSGVKASFHRGKMRDLEVAPLRASDPSVESSSMRHEPTPNEIASMLDEARLAADAGLTRAALLVAWAAIEASLRKLATPSGTLSRELLQPARLVAWLQHSDQISHNDVLTIQNIRHLRMAAAHGLAANRVELQDVEHALNLAARVLEQATKKPVI